MEGGKKWLIAMWAVIIVVILGGVGLYFLQISQANELRTQLTSIAQQQSASIEQLSSQISELKTQQTITSDVVGNVSVTDPGSGTGGTASVSASSAASVGYSNPTYGFSLQFPAEWQGYSTEKLVSANNTTIYFGMKNWSRIFAIGVYTKAQWAKADVLAKRSYLKENNSYVFTGAKSQDYGTPEYNALVNDYDRIIKTFSAFNK